MQVAAGVRLEPGHVPRAAVPEARAGVPHVEARAAGGQLQRGDVEVVRVHRKGTEAEGAEKGGKDSGQAEGRENKGDDA